MRTLLPVATNEQIIDLALEILTNDLGLSLDWISSRIAFKEFPYSITDSTLTKIRSLKREGNQYREKISEGLNRLNKREKLKQALVEILKKDHEIEQLRATLHHLTGGKYIPPKPTPEEKEETIFQDDFLENTYFGNR